MDAYTWFRQSVSKLKNYSLPSDAATAANTSKLTEDDERIYGIGEQLIEFVESFSLDTFRNFVIPGSLSLCFVLWFRGVHCWMFGSFADAEESARDDGGSSGNVRMDLSDWQETHAMRILSRVKVLLLSSFFPMFERFFRRSEKGDIDARQQNYTWFYYYYFLNEGLLCLMN